MTNIILLAEEIVKCPSCERTIIRGSDGSVTYCSECVEIIQFVDGNIIKADLENLDVDSRKLLLNIQKLIKEKRETKIITEL